MARQRCTSSAGSFARERRAVDPGAGLGQQVDRLRRVVADADLLEHAQRLLVDELLLLPREVADARPGHAACTCRPRLTRRPPRATVAMTESMCRSTSSGSGGTSWVATISRARSAASAASGRPADSSKVPLRNARGRHTSRARVRAGALAPEEVPADADLEDVVHERGGLVDGVVAQVAAQRADLVVVEHVLGQARDLHAVEPAGRDERVGAGEGGRERRHAALGPGLEVGRLGVGRHAGRLRGKPVELAHLQTDQVDEPDLRARGDVPAGAHVGHGGAHPGDERAAGVRQLVEHDAAEQLGHVQDAGAEQRHRAGGAGLRHGQHEDGHAAVHELEAGLGHLPVVLQRRDGAVGHREVRAAR